MSSSGFERHEMNLQGDSGLSNLRRRRDNSPSQTNAAQRLEEHDKFLRTAPIPESNSEHQQESLVRRLEIPGRFAWGTIGGALAGISARSVNPSVEPADVIAGALASGTLSALVPEFLSSDNNSVQPMRASREENILPGEHSGGESTDEIHLKTEHRMRMQMIADHLRRTQQLELILPDQDSSQSWEHFAAIAPGKLNVWCELA